MDGGMCTDKKLDGDVNKHRQTYCSNKDISSTFHGGIKINKAYDCEYLIKKGDNKTEILKMTKNIK